MLGRLITGDNVILRAPTTEDLPLFVNWFNDPGVTSTLGRIFPMSLAGEKEWLLNVEADKDQIVWVIVDKVTGTVIGNTGIHEIDWLNRLGTTGIMIGNRDFWGRGLATEAMALRTKFAFEELGLQSLRSGFIGGNGASRKAQLRVGYRVVGYYKSGFFRGGRWHERYITEITREDWKRDQE